MSISMIGARFFSIILALSLIGCATAVTDQAETFLLGEKDVFEASAAFEKLTKTEPGTNEYEKARIDYLFERLSKSQYNFVRNEKVYSPSRAVMHIKWKYFRYRSECPTAEAFIQNCASGSRMSGNPYLIKYDNKTYYPLENIYFNELKLLDDEFIRYQEELKKKLEILQKEKEELIKSEEKNIADIGPQEAVTDKEEEEKAANEEA